MVTLREVEHGCRACYLGESGDKGPVAVEAGAKVQLLVLGEAPGKKEVEEGRPFMGGAGREVREAVRRAKVFSREVAWSYVMRCDGGWRGKGKRKVEQSVVEACRVNTTLELVVLKPKVVLLCGATALKVFRPDLLVTKHRGVPFMVREGTVAVPTVDVLATLQGDVFVEQLWKDVEQAAKRLRRGLFVDWPEECVWCGEEVETYDPMGVAYCGACRTAKGWDGRKCGQLALM
jgi:uracil-DNA glycosylase